MGRRRKITIVPKDSFVEIYKNWKNPSYYEFSKEDQDQICWELLRRNPLYQEDYEKMLKDTESNTFFEVKTNRDGLADSIDEISGKEKNVFPIIKLQEKWSFSCCTEEDCSPKKEYSNNVRFINSFSPRKYTSSHTELKQQRYMSGYIRSENREKFQLYEYIENIGRIDRRREFDLCLSMRDGNLVFELDPLCDIKKQLDYVKESLLEQKKKLNRLTKKQDSLTMFDGNNKFENFWLWLRIFDATVYESNNIKVTEDVICRELKLNDRKVIGRAVNKIQGFLEDPKLLFQKMAFS